MCGGVKTTRRYKHKVVNLAVRTRRASHNIRQNQYYSRAFRVYNTCFFKQPQELYTIVSESIGHATTCVNEMHHRTTGVKGIRPTVGWGCRRWLDSYQKKKRYTFGFSTILHRTTTFCNSFISSDVQYNCSAQDFS